MRPAGSSKPYLDDRSLDSKSDDDTDDDHGGDADADAEEEVQQQAHSTSSHGRARAFRSELPHINVAMNLSVPWGYPGYAFQSAVAFPWPQVDTNAGGSDGLFGPREPVARHDSIASQKAALESSARPSSSRSCDQAKLRDEEWNECSTLALLQAWGNKYLELERGCLSRNDWTQITEHVVRAGKTFKTGTQCRNRIDTLKKKYKREKHKQADNGRTWSNWLYYKHMEAALNPQPKPMCLPCAVDAGQFIQNDPDMWRNKNSSFVAGTDGRHTSPDDPGSGSSEDCKGARAFHHCNQAFSNNDTSDSLESLPISSDNELKQHERSKKQRCMDAPFDSLAKAIKNFGDIYEKVEIAKQQQILDLEKTRMEFTRKLELQKMQLLMQTHMELAKMKQPTTDMDVAVRDLSD